MALDIHWQKRHFMHLRGLECTVPQRLYRRRNKPVRSEVFFDALLSGKTNGLNIRHSHNRGITNDKLSVLHPLTGARTIPPK
ncbi:PBECR4 domain-containing protein [Bifidobacterium margollesii]|uniref:PBECR4 domain-containing protein n=1 Tax=Bifidobacterium margollesii TaxID=2020964 RepID=UPI0013FD4052